MLGDDAFLLYELVLRRFLATLAPDALWQTLKVLYDAGGEEYTATGGRLLSPGWHTVYPFSEAKETILPVFSIGEKLPISSVSCEEKETQPPSRFTQSKLIQRMEELGLGTKSTRHEVIAKLVSRKYVEGNPLRPTLVGRVVIESLEHYADTITKPDMTQTLEAHMQLIKQSQRTREDVVRESRGMLHAAFDQLEAHEREIGDDIRSRTAEEMNLGACPVCRTGTLAIKHMRGSTQFIGCSRYPECTFNIGLPLAQWGFAVRTDDVCQKHGLNYVRLVRKGARPWDIGCPLCHHISSNRESLIEIPSLTPALIDRFETLHIYTASDLAKSEVPYLMTTLDVSKEHAERIVRDAKVAMDLLRKRSECRKFMRNHIIPRKGRSYSVILKSLAGAGIRDIESLAKADPAVLVKAGISEKEAADCVSGARAHTAAQIFRTIGIPPLSIRKYIEAGIFCPEDFCRLQPSVLAEKTKMSTDTVYRHAGLVCNYLNLPAPKKISKAQVEKGKKELLAIRGMTESTIRQLSLAGIHDISGLIGADIPAASARSAIPEETIRLFKSLAEKRLKNAIIEL
jgi:DNA topoisomerase-1